MANIKDVYQSEEHLITALSGSLRNPAQYLRNLLHGHRPFAK